MKNVLKKVKTELNTTKNFQKALQKANTYRKQRKLYKSIRKKENGAKTYQNYTKSIDTNNTEQQTPKL